MMSLKSPASAEARLLKLKEEIALRKQQRLQSQTDSSDKNTKYTPDGVKQQTCTPGKVNIEKSAPVRIQTEITRHDKVRTKNSTPDKVKTDKYTSKKAETEKSIPVKVKTAKSASDKVETPVQTETSVSDKTEVNTSEEVSSCDRKGKKRRVPQKNSESPEVVETDVRSQDTNPEASSAKKRKKQKLTSSEHVSSDQDQDEITSKTNKKIKKSKTKNPSVSDSEVSDEMLTENSQKRTPKSNSVRGKIKKKQKQASVETLLNDMMHGCPGKVSFNKKEKARENEWMKKTDIAKFGEDNGLEHEDTDSESDGDKNDNTEGNVEQEDEEEMEDTIGGFSVLGNYDNETTKPVKRRLPGWLANPTIIVGGAGLKHHGKDAVGDKDDATVFSILDDDLKKKLQDNDIHYFFPVQRTFIPELWEDLKFGLQGGRYGFPPRDICVSAPTGSGKSLSYVLPIVQSLKNRLVPKIYALVVLPVRDLAEQVFKVFCQYCAGTELKVGLVVGKTTVSVEQDLLVKKMYPGLYHSLVDIVVATPGRLVDHVKSTPGFDLSWLRFLVIDEADRLMEDIVKHDWLLAVELAAYDPPPQTYFPNKRKKPGPLTVLGMCVDMPLQKLLFSATLSHNPEKLEQLNLVRPHLMTSVVSSTPTLPARQLQQEGEGEGEDKNEDIDDNPDTFVGKYTTPEGLTEYLVESSAEEKPLYILHFLHNLKFRNVLCFTNSVEATHRLCLLLKLFGGIKVREFSSRLPAERRKKILRQFSNGKIDLLVCSDAMARGMDVDNVKYVISYDNPPYIKTYIHRVGRTARAGRTGMAFSLLEKKEFFHFKSMMRAAGKWSRIKEMKYGRHALRPLEDQFRAALAQLPQIIKNEKKKDHK